MLIICDLRNQGRLAAKSAMSSQFPYVVAIIARSTAVAMKRHGGKRWASIQPFPLVLCGWKAIHYPQGAVTTKVGRSPISEIKQGPNDKTKPIFDVGPQ
jgi:hypothetical protein